MQKMILQMRKNDFILKFFLKNSRDIVSENMPTQYVPIRWRFIALFLFLLLLLVKSINLLGVPQFWAEDGKIFFLQAREYGLRALFIPYAGYFHVGTRILAFIATFFDEECAPTVYFWMAFLVHLLVMYFVFSSRFFLSLPAKFFAALSLVFIPIGAEVFFKVTNLHWHLAVLVPLLAVSGPCENFNLGWWGKMVGIVLLGLTDPYIILFAPLFFIRFAALWKNRPERLFAFTVLVCAAVQMSSVLLNPSLIVMSSDGLSSMTLAEKIRGFLGCPIRYVLGFFFFPWRCYLLRESLSLSCTAVGIAGGFVLMAIGVCSAIFQWRHSWRSLMFCGIVVATSLVACCMRGPMAYVADRYYFIPFVFTAFMIVNLACRTKTPNSSSFLAKSDLGVLLSRALLCVYVVLSLPSFVLPRVDDLNWHAEYQRAIVDPQHAIPIHPVDNPIWTFSLPVR